MRRPRRDGHRPPSRSAPGLTPGFGVFLLLTCVLYQLGTLGPVLAQATDSGATAAKLPNLRTHRLRGLTVAAVRSILGEPGGELALAALAAPYPGDSERARVPLWVEIDGSTLLAHNQAETARVEVYAYALDERSSVAAYLAEAFALDVAELGEAVWQSGLKFHGELHLPPGSYTVRMLVRLRQSAASGLAVVPVEVPDFAAGRVAAMPLFAGPRERDAWLAVRQWRAADDAGSPGSGEPFVVDGRALSPAARPVLVAGRPVQTHLFLRDTTQGAPAGELRAAVRFAAPEAPLPGTAPAPGRAPEPAAEAGIDEMTRAGGGDLSVLTIRFTPPELDPGEYSLRVEVDDGTGTATRSAAARVVVVEPQRQGTELLWTDLRWLNRPVVEPPAEAEASRGAADELTEGGPPRKRGRKFRQLATDYRAALAALAADSEAAGRDALFDLESRALGLEGGDEKSKLLLAAQLQIARQLAASDPEALLPALGLHHRLHETYSQRRLYPLIFHARSAIEILAEAYFRAGGSPTIAAGALAALAGHLQRANLPSGCRRLFRRALDYDAAHPGALLGLAASYEKYGHYPQAVELLETLAAARPDLGEGLLRLAVNHQRTGGRKRARELLRSAAAESSPPWVRSLASQELARAHLATGALDAAAELLEEATARMPGDAGLAVLLAHVYDRLAQPSAALDRVAAVAATDGGRASPRKVYDTWPRALLDAEAAALDASATRHLETLARVLSAGG